ncbi:MAG: flagellar biosynthetic protein FliO [Candidatus Electryonea clarkiae]|nr:flagellar biosynthetic protein FliO [Candidatus Electryonea clarkiae]MDP8287313.1 flagellar biosynthetic protein FliO [Candidatus Electryonea clarkiae]
MQKKIFNVLVVILIHLPLLVFAESDSGLYADEMSVGATLAKAAFYLFLVIALIFGLVYLLKRILPGLATKASLKGSQESSIEIIDAKTIGPKRTIMLVRTGKREILVGSSEHGLSALGQWELNDIEMNSLADNNVPNEESS